MHKTLLAIMILLCSVSITKAQRLQLGFRLECNGVDYTEGYRRNIFSGLQPTGLQVHMALFPIEMLVIEARGGAELNSLYYVGKEYGLFARYYFIKDVYGVTGYMVHDILRGDHTGWGRYSKTLRMPAIGVGSNFYGDAYFELMYLHSGTQVVGYDFTGQIDYDPLKVKQTKIYWIIKLGFGFSWDIFSWRY